MIPSPPAVIACVALLLGQVAADRLPPALEACREARMALRTAEVHWAGASSSSRHFPNVEFGRSTLLAYDDLAEFDLGTPDGVTAVDEQGHALRMQTKELFNDQMHLSYQVGEISAIARREYKFRPRFEDVRNFGLLPQRYREYAPAGEVLLTYPPGDHGRRRFTQTQSGTQAEVILETADGLEVHWFIDPSRGYNVTRAELWVDDKLEAYSVSELALYGETWFPAQVQYFVGDRPQPETTISIRDARFNEPDLPAELTPRELDLEPGIAVMIFEPGQDAPSTLAWTGEELTSADEWNDLRRKGLVEPGPTVKTFEKWAETQKHRAAASGSANDAPPSPTATGQPASRRSSSGAGAASRPVQSVAEHPWETYTRAFILAARLDDAQKQKAMTILRECRTRGDAVWASRRATVERLKKLITQIENAKKQNAHQAEKLEKLRADREKAYAPLDGVFERYLQPSLLRLLTPVQREAHQAEIDAIPALPWRPV